MGLRRHRGRLSLVHAFPLRLGSQVIAVMNGFGDVKGGDFTDAGVPVMQTLAEVAAIGLL